MADLQRLHLHHLRFGAPGVAVDLETLASVRALTTKELVDEIEAAARDPAGEVGGWASFVVRYVRAAIEAGLLDVG